MVRNPLERKKLLAEIFQSLKEMLVMLSLLEGQTEFICSPNSRVDTYEIQVVKPGFGLTCMKFPVLLLRVRRS